MTSLARVIAAVTGIICLLLAGAVLVRQGALAVDAGVRWPASTLWGELTGEPTWATTGVAAAVLAGITAVLIVLAIREVSGGGGPEIIEYRRRRRHRAAVGAGPRQGVAPPVPRHAPRIAGDRCRGPQGRIRLERPRRGLRPGLRPRGRARRDAGCVPRRHATGRGDRSRAARPRRHVDASAGEARLMPEGRPGHHQVFMRSRPAGDGVSASPRVGRHAQNGPTAAPAPSNGA